MMPIALILADESKKSGPIGLVVILLLCIACYFLFKSMSRHMRKVREEFPPAPPATDASTAPPTAPPAAPPTAAPPTAEQTRED